MKVEEKDIVLSIIVPVYNAEKYLRKFLSSILGQNFQKYEVVLVNDGSTDNSLNICNEFKRESNKIKVVSKENGGVSSARNKGLEIAQGEYIMFADADDYYTNDAFSIIADSIYERKTDLVCYSYFHVENGQYVPNIILKEAKVLELSQMIEQYWKLWRAGMLTSVWNKVFKKEIIQQNKISFDEKMTFAEDAVFVLDYMKYIKNMFLLDKSLYYYVMHEEQVTMKPHARYFEMLNLYFSKLKRFLERFGECKEDYYLEWFHTILNSSYHQNFKMYNEKKIETNTKTIEMCKILKPTSLYDKLCFNIIKRKKTKLLGIVCWIRYKIGQLKHRLFK